MPLPEFTNDEQYLISFAKSTRAREQTNTYMWGYLVGGVALAGFGVFHDNVPMMLGAFAVVCGCRVYEELTQTKWTPVWREIIKKYEDAAIGADAADNPNSTDG